jgi:hypothetical protein
MFRSITILLITTFASLMAVAQDVTGPQSQGAEIDIGSRRELFVEDGLIDRLAGNSGIAIASSSSAKGRAET